MILDTIVSAILRHDLDRIRTEPGEIWLRHAFEYLLTGVQPSDDEILEDIRIDAERQFSELVRWFKADKVTIGDYGDRAGFRLPAVAIQRASMSFKDEQFIGQSRRTSTVKGDLRRLELNYQVRYNGLKAWALTRNPIQTGYLWQILFKVLIAHYATFDHLGFRQVAIVGNPEWTLFDDIKAVGRSVSIEALHDDSVSSLFRAPTVRSFIPVADAAAVDDSDETQDPWWSDDATATN